MSGGALGDNARHTHQMINAATKVVPVRTISIDHGSPDASRINGMSVVSAMPPMAVSSNPLAWSFEIAATPVLDVYLSITPPAH
jgi:hypothetical protein